MPEGNKPFVVTDRRKFTMDGEARSDADRPAREERPAAVPPPPISGAEAPATFAEKQVETLAAAPPANDLAAEPAGGEAELPAPTPEQSEQAKRAYEATADRLETAIRATNPGIEHPPVMNFEQLVQSVYLTAIMQLGGATPEGEQPRVDLLGARSSIDMMGVLTEKTQGNLSGREQKFLDSALFELRMAFLEMTQALARTAQTRGGAAGGEGGFGAPGAPTLVR